ACRGRHRPAREAFRGVGAGLETTRAPPGARARPKGLQFCRAGFAGRGTAFARSTERHTIASDSDPRPGLGSISSRPGPVAGALAALLLLAATGGRAAARSLAIEHFDAEVVVARDASIEVTETIRAPAGATDVRSLAFTGSYGSRAQDADVQTLSGGVDIDMRRPLAFHEGLTAVVGWSKGAVEEPGPLARALLFLRANWLFTVPL